MGKGFWKIFFLIFVLNIFVLISSPVWAENFQILEEIRLEIIRIEREIVKIREKFVELIVQKIEEIEKEIFERKKIVEKAKEFGLLPDEKIPEWILAGLPAPPEKELLPEEKPTLSVSLSANPSFGIAPLKGVDLKADVSGTATGTINYTFYCHSEESTDITELWCQKKENVSETSYTAIDCCDYDKKGTYFAKVIVERGGLRAEARTIVNVRSPLLLPPPPPPPPPPPACQDQYPSGAQTYSVSTKTIPEIYQIIVDPLDVEYLANQTVTASINDANGNPITEVLGSAITDNKTVDFTLSLISGTETDGVWQGSWKLEDSICENYQISITATSQSGTSMVTLSFR